MNVDTTHEDLIARLERDLDRIAQTTPTTEPGRFDPSLPPLHADRNRPRRAGMLLAVAASTAALGLAGLIAVTSRQTPEPPPALDASTPEPVSTLDGATLPPTGTSPLGCTDEAGCVGFDRLPVAAGATDFYVGAESLGQPVVSDTWFDSLTRCAALSEDFSTCERIEGIAGVELVQHPTSDQPVTTDSSGTADGGPIRVGTTFTEISPDEYAASWGLTPQPDGPQEATVVRGHEAVRYRDGASPALVWEERPGVLVWIVVPGSMESELVAIAEGVRRVDGPDTIPERIVVADLATTWNADDNDADGLIAARADGLECVGFGYVDRCGASIGERTIITSTDGLLAPGDDVPQTLVAGSAPRDVASVRVRFGADDFFGMVQPIEFSDFESRFYAVEYDRENAPSPITEVAWLDATGDVLATLDPSADGTAPAAVTVPGSTVAPVPATTTTIASGARSPCATGRDEDCGTYTVIAGDFPIGVAEKLCVSLVELIEANGWSSDWSEFPMPGSEILVPTVGSRDSCPDPAATEPATEATVFETTTTSLLADE